MEFTTDGRHHWRTEVHQHHRCSAFSVASRQSKGADSVQPMGLSRPPSTLLLMGTQCTISREFCLDCQLRKARSLTELCPVQLVVNRMPGLGWQNNSLFSFWGSPFSRPAGVQYNSTDAVPKLAQPAVSNLQSSNTRPEHCILLGSRKR